MHLESDFKLQLSNSLILPYNRYVFYTLTSSILLYNPITHLSLLLYGATPLKGNMLTSSCHHHDSSSSQPPITMATYDGGDTSSTTKSTNTAKIAIVAPLTPLSGNLTTTQRLASILLEEGNRRSSMSGDTHCNIIVDVTNSKSATSSPTTTPAHHAAFSSSSSVMYYDVCFVLHAHRGGTYLFPGIGESDDTDTVEEGVGVMDVEYKPPPPPQPIILAKKYVLIFGGTDVNEAHEGGTGEFGGRDPRGVMQRVIERMDAVVCFSESLAVAARAAWPGVRWGMAADVDQVCDANNSITPTTIGSTMKDIPMFIIPQSVESIPPPCPPTTSPSTTTCAVLDGILHQCGLDSNSHVVVLPGGLRRVKGPEFAIEAFKHMCEVVVSSTPQSSMGVKGMPVLLLVGPLLQPDYLTGLLTTCCDYHLQLVTSDPSTPDTPVKFRRASSSPSPRPSSRCGGLVVWVGGLPRELLTSIVCDSRSVATINTSVSEGQPQALLETMGLGGVVVGRGIPANRDVIRHNETGYLADTPKEMGAMLAELYLRKTTHASTTDGSSRSNDTTSMSGVLSYSSSSVVGPAAKEYVHTHHSPSLEGARYMNLLDTLLT